ncbi:hypothetical protein BASA62_007045 [Batrachochytrium salamandrivorans]|nr:hypothetical protein BASA62_007045 [Batrachochytrium salamandrivorans]
MMEDIPAADGIIQLFKSDVTASQFRYLKNDATESTFYKGLNSNNPGSKAWDATSDTSRYSGFGSMEDSSILNTLGQAYFNPGRPIHRKSSSRGNSAKNSIPELLSVFVNTVRGGKYAGQLVEDNGVKLIAHFDDSIDIPFVVLVSMRS